MRMGTLPKFAFAGVPTVDRLWCITHIRHFKMDIDLYDIILVQQIIEVAYLLMSRFLE